VFSSLEEGEEIELTILRWWQV